MGYKLSYLLLWGNCEFVTGYKTAHLLYAKIEVFFTKYNIGKVLFCLEEKKQSVTRIHMYNKH